MPQLRQDLVSPRKSLGFNGIGARVSPGGVVLGLVQYVNGHGPFELGEMPEGAAKSPGECMCARICQIKVNLRRWCG